MIPLLRVGDLAVLGSGEEAVVAPVPQVADLVADLVADRGRHGGTRLLVASADAARAVLVRPGVHPERLWDVAEAHRILHGGWAAGPSLAWAVATGLDPAGVPTTGSGDLFDFVRTGRGPGAADGDDGDDLDDLESPVLADGHLRADAFAASWASTPARLRAAAGALAELGRRQAHLVTSLGARATSTVHSESAAALLCLELERDGLPLDRPTALELIELSAGPRPRDEADASRIRADRDREVLRHAPGRELVDLRNPTQVRELLAAVGVIVPSTRAHVLQPFAATHPLVGALLQWRKDERIATTYSYRWLDDHVGHDDRLRGAWSACDGAAGRMTAQNGLHNLPSPLRPAVSARPGHVFVRADLGQVEPRVLAVVSGDRAFAEASVADDLYAPVAAKLRVERPVAKIAVLAAMYGQRSGAAGEALKDLQRAYPVAMKLLDDAYAAGVARQPLRTFGGRLLPLDRILGGAATSPGGDHGPEPATDEDGSGALSGAQARAVDSARGRFARNAVIQGAAAELFKAWAATVRHAVTPLGAQIVLCLHDELLLHVDQEHADEVVHIVEQSLTDAARRWAGTDRVRFVSDTSVVRRWSDAKG
ncbi:MAG: DNA polymerase [Actinomycetota bacterium]|nr:DNA polymerase [Actinomycetota bacterium]